MDTIEQPPSEEMNTSLLSLFLKLKGMVARLGFYPSRPTVQSEEELKKLIDDGEKQGVIEEDEHAMLQSILEFGDTTVREVMVPRIEMSCLNVDSSFDQVMDFVIKDGHSRIPVYRDLVDNIVGVLYVKDLLRLYHADKKNFKLSSIMRHMSFFIPETKKIGELLKEFQRRKVHLAVVVDEYGGIAGLVTIEDLLEELVGEIEDEYDIDIEKMMIVEGDSIFADGRLEIDELENYFHISLKGDNYETLSGLIFNLLERVPQQGEEIDYRGLRFTIEKADERRIHRVKIKRMEVSSEEILSSSLQDEKG